MPGKKSALAFEFRAWGHPSITAVNKKKITIAKGPEALDDSVIAVRSEAAAVDLPDEMKEALSERKKISLTIETAGVAERIDAFGSFKMDPTDVEMLVIEKADFVSPNTVGVRSNKAAADLPRNLVNLLRDDNQEIKVELRVLET